jgi:site-specific recombinase XerD
MDRDAKGIERAQEMRKWRAQRGGMRKVAAEKEERGRLEGLLAEWGEAQRRHALSERTIETRHGHVKRFLRWCRTRDVTEPGWISAGLLDAWLKELRERRTAKGSPLAEATKEGMILAVQTFLAFLVAQRALEVNPLADYQVRRCRTGRLPTVLDEAAEAAEAAVLAVPDLTDALGIRDRPRPS